MVYVKRKEGVNASVLQRREGCRDGLQNSACATAYTLLINSALKLTILTITTHITRQSANIPFICADQIILFPGGIQHLNVNDSFV